MALSAVMSDTIKDEDKLFEYVETTYLNVINSPLKTFKILHFHTHSLQERNMKFDSISTMIKISNDVKITRMM
jgi:hypothetical protein